MELNAAVAENIKRIRKTQKLSLERTAELAGVSRSMLGQIERGEANPSVAILGRLAGALKVPAEEFLRNESFEPRLLCRELDNKPQRSDAGKVTVRPSVPYDETARLAGEFVDLYITGCYAPAPDVTGCLCTVTVLSGAAQVTSGGETVELQERDALRLPSDQPWEVRNQGNGVAKLYLLRQYRRRT
jgi:XRE family transcriptional regulator, regulator of sulfur utilization